MALLKSSISSFNFNKQFERTLRKSLSLDLSLNECPKDKFPKFIGGNDHLCHVLILDEF